MMTPKPVPRPQPPAVQPAGSSAGSPPHAEWTRSASPSIASGAAAFPKPCGWTHCRSAHPRADCAVQSLAAGRAHALGAAGP
eukprot:scaffold59087_cov26-Tisochrysis_lutea.AAC.2